MIFIDNNAPGKVFAHFKWFTVWNERSYSFRNPPVRNSRRFPLSPAGTFLILSTGMSFWRFGSKESDRSKIIASLITTVIHSNGFLPTKYQFNSNVFLPTKSQFNSNIFLPTKYQFNSNSFPFEKNQFNSNGFLPTKINSIQMISFLLKIYLIQSVFLLSNIYPRLMPIEIVNFLWFFKKKKILFAKAH